MIILQKSNPSLASAKTAIFPFIFPFHFHRSFKLRFNASHWHIDTSFSRTTVYLPTSPPAIATLARRVSSAPPF
jgi:hypothetical protein